MAKVIDPIKILMDPNLKICVTRSCKTLFFHSEDGKHCDRCNETIRKEIDFIKSMLPRPFHN
jgi:hypothetical protein